MPNLEEFLGKSKYDWTGWSEYPGTFGCQKCPADVPMAYFNTSKGQIKWVCSEGHESVINFE